MKACPICYNPKGYGAKDHIRVFIRVAQPKVITTDKFWICPTEPDFEKYREAIELLIGED